MTPKVFVGALVGALIFCCLVVEQARAATVYTYAGQNFTAFGIFDITPPDGTYTTSMNVTGNFTLQDPLAGNLPFTNITADVQSFSFADGRNTITNLTATIFSFFVVTDPLGNITGWSIIVRQDDPTFGTAIGSQRRQIITGVGSDEATFLECVTLISGGCIAQQDRGSNERTPGSWSSATVDATPLPAALPLFAGGLGALSLLGWRRKKKAAALAA